MHQLLHSPAATLGHPASCIAFLIWLKTCSVEITSSSRKEGLESCSRQGLRSLSQLWNCHGADWRPTFCHPIGYVTWEQEGSVQWAQLAMKCTIHYAGQTVTTKQEFCFTEVLRSGCCIKCFVHETEVKNLCSEKPLKLPKRAPMWWERLLSARDHSASSR